MKCLVFHSVKGGVGRTRALSELALALAHLDYKVLMLDLDYTGPGLHRKFDLAPAPGYLDYLGETDVTERAKEIADDKRWERLKDRIQRVKTNLFLLSAGDESRQDYWDFVSSFRFHRLFYFFDEEIKGLSNKTFPLSYLQLNVQAFKHDRALLQERLSLDYLLVDCKTTLETSGVAIMLWGDRIAHFFPCNAEGEAYALLIARAVARYNLDKKREIRFIPVVARVPDDFSEVERNKLHERMEKVWSTWNDVAHIPFFSQEDFVFLSELRDIEANDRLLINRENKEKDGLWQLSHDQIALFARLVPSADPADSKSTYLNDERWWYQQLGMDPRKKIVSEPFERHLHQGTMVNAADGERNIAFRVSTLHHLVNRLLYQRTSDARTGSLAEQALELGGHTAGYAFATDWKQRWDNTLTTIKVTDLLREWANFDSKVGFGKIKIDEEGFSLDQLSGFIIVVGDPFLSLPSNSDQGGQDLRYFFAGYARAVLEIIFGLKDGTIAVHPIDDLVTLPESAKKIVDAESDANSGVYRFERSGKECKSAT